jgi:hypothetical protein
MRTFVTTLSRARAFAQPFRHAFAGSRGPAGDACSRCR